VQLETSEQRQIALENALERNKLSLAQAVGLMPVSQPFTLADRMEFKPSPAPSLEQATAQATRDREDAQAASARVQAAEETLQSRRAGHLPSVAVHGDYGTIGNTFEKARPTFAAGALVSVPLFNGGLTRGQV